MRVPTVAQLVVVKNLLVVARTFRASGHCPVPELVHLAVTLQESSWDDQAVNEADPGGSYGPYQIDQAAHPDTAQLAVSPWANYAFHICAQPWTAAWTQLDGATAWADTAQRGAFLEAFAPLAQGSVAWPAGLGDLRYQVALNALELVS